MVSSKIMNECMDELFQAVLLLETVKECYNFFEDIVAINRVKRCLRYGAGGFALALSRLHLHEAN